MYIYMICSVITGYYLGGLVLAGRVEAFMLALLVLRPNDEYCLVPRLPGVPGCELQEMIT